MFFRPALLFVLILILSKISNAQSDTLILYDYSNHREKEIIVDYDHLLSPEGIESHSGESGNLIDLGHELPDTLNLHFSENILVENYFDLMAYPIRANCKVLKLTNQGSEFTSKGSGALIGPNLVLTAGHIAGWGYFSDEFEWSDSLAVAPSFTKGKPHNSFGYAKVLYAVVFKDFYLKSNNVSSDIALLVLDSPIGLKTGWLGMSYVPNDSFLLQHTFYHYSYPAKGPYNGNDMYFKYGEFTSYRPDINFANNSTLAFNGESGSVFFDKDLKIFGIRTYGSGYTVLNKERFRALKYYIDQKNHVTGIMDQHLSEEVKLIPNPATDKISIRFSDDRNINKEFSMVIRDIQGKAVYQMGAVRINDQIELKDLQSGIYLIEILNREKKYVKKLVIK